MFGVVISLKFSLLMDYIFNQNRWFWLPKEHTKWTSDDYNYLPNVLNIFTYPFIIAIFLYFIRNIFER